MAATGTPTPNIGLRIPQGTDPASVDDINYNSNLLDTKIGAVGNDSVQDQIDALNSNLTNVKNQVYGDQLSALPSVSSLANGFVGFVLAQTVTIGSETLLSGTRCIGFNYNGTAHVIAMPNGAIIRVLRGDSDGWSVIAKLNGTF